MIFRKYCLIKLTLTQLVLSPQLIFAEETFNAASGAAFNAVNSGSVGRATVAEMIMTFILTLVVCMGAINDKTKVPFVPFCIGLTVTANILAGYVVHGKILSEALECRV